MPFYKFFLVLCFASFLFVACSPKAVENDSSTEDSSSLSSEEAANEWLTLSDGNSLEDHWQMYNGRELAGWQLVDQEMQASGAGWDADQDLITKEAYDNFDLELEWKLESGNSSGIFYFVQQSAEQPIYESAPEYQVIDDLGWSDPLNPDQLTAGNYAMHPPNGASPKPIGEWNASRIVVRYPQIEHWLNGKKVVEYKVGDEDWKARKAAGKWAGVADYGQARSGHIGLQNAGKVAYRNVRIREL